MKGSETRLTGFMEGADKRFVIPVYQRKYDWKLDNCRQLYEDLKRIIRDGLSSHFFGSIVSSIVPQGGKIEYHIIDGQQRLTTVTLLLLAISNLLAQGKLTAQKGRLSAQIRDRFLISPWEEALEAQIKLRPVKGDREALVKLFGEEADHDPTSNLTLNYRFFCDELRKEETPVDELFLAIAKLEIISITLDQSDNPQRIFESLNSTGLALTEGDKIRNYILMGQPPQQQTRLYDSYWTTIERCTRGDVSGFIRDYLSIKQRATPTVGNVYRAFKEYAENVRLPMETLLVELRLYARLFEKLLTCKSGLGNQRLDDCLYRLMRLDVTVTRPFFVEVLRLNQDGKLSVEEVLQVFLITENYLFRRNICEVPTNALNKVFVSLNREVLRYDNTAENYVQKLIYALLSKRESGRFPDDGEFTAALGVKPIYHMRGKYRAYLFERFENFDTVETKDVLTHLDNHVYSIEHIMPQTLTPAWREALGPSAPEIHSTWLNRLANLTLTGYNPSLSNNTFQEKRDAPVGGYKVSGLKMNQRIAQKASWGLPELEERNEEMLTRAKVIWAYPHTTFVPAEKTFESCTLEDENAVLTGRNIVRYSYQNVEQPTTSWADMFAHVVKFLHQKDKSVLSNLAYSTTADLSRYVSHDEEALRSPLKLDEGIYITMNTSTDMKISLLRRLFALYGADPMDLVFYLRDEESAEAAKANRDDIRRRYWTYALPLLQQQNLSRGTFGSTVPGPNNTVVSSTGTGGLSIACLANFDCARVTVYLGKGDPTQSKATFDLLHGHKEEIEEEVGTALAWNRADESKISQIYLSLPGVSIANEADWPRMARFHAEWSNRLATALLPYLQTEAGDEERRAALAALLRQWAMNRPEVKLHLNKSGLTYTRFTTPTMSAILPEIPGALSSWHTETHYFYEIVNRNGHSVFMKFVINALNATEDFLAACESLQAHFPAKVKKDNWLWRTHFKTLPVAVDEALTQEAVNRKLDECFAELLAFETAVKEAWEKEEKP